MLETAFQSDAFQFDTLAFQINVVVPAVDETPARTAAGGPTGRKRKRQWELVYENERSPLRSRPSVVQAVTVGKTVIAAPVVEQAEEDDIEGLLMGALLFFDD